MCYNPIEKTCGRENTMEKINAWKTYTESDLEQVEATAREYRSFLDQGKTERECTSQTIEMAEKAGYRDLAQVIDRGERLSAGDKVYVNVMGKAVMLFYLGRQSLEKGLNIIGAHIDSPRMDLKQNPFYEDNGFCYGDTHYYGGIKKYQWVARGLALHGVVTRTDGTTVPVVIGENPEDPVLGISDLLPHLAGDQMGKKASEVIDGEGLDVLLGSKPDKEEEKNPVLAAVLAYLKENYGIEEEDMISSEIEVVPAGKCRDFGLDRSMLLGYGHDDRVCAFASVKAILELKETPEYTCCCLLADKEEIGSVGATGMRAHYFENAVAELLNLTQENYSDLLLRRALAASRMLSCDVSAGFDPLYASAFEKKNAALLGCGVCYNKFTGSRGKSGSNDANAEFIGKLRKIMADNQVTFQTAELGKVDVGGGGTIAYICALYGMEVIDSGVAVLSMHAPEEIISKADLYEAVKAYAAFMKDAE